MNLRVLIADDEALSRERLKRFLAAEPGIELVAECASGIEAANAILDVNPDVAFLDVTMPELDGFEVLKAVEAVHLPAIIFVTAYDQFALRAFEFHAVDYLLKPFDLQRFRLSLGRARHRLEADLARTRGQAEPEKLVSPPKQGQFLERLAIKAGGRITIVKTEDIDWISAADNYAELHVGNKTHLLRMTIRVLADRLPAHRFARISRSVLVNLERVKEIRSRSHGDYYVVLLDGACLPGSRNFRNGLEGLLR